MFLPSSVNFTTILKMQVMMMDTSGHKLKTSRFSLVPHKVRHSFFLLLLFFIMVIIPSWKNAGENSDRFRSSPLIIRILAVDSDWKDMCSQSRRVVWDHGTDRDTKVTIVLSISPVKRYRSNTDTKRAMVVGGFLWYHGGLVHGLVN